MALERFDFFRIRLLVYQEDLFDDRPREQVLCSLVDNVAQATKAGATKWRIGDLEDLGESRRYFRLGRLSYRRSPAFKDGHFVQVTTEDHPYTDVFLDCPSNLIFIAHNSQLSQDTEALARRLAFMLRLYNPSAVNGLDIRIDPISDPESLLGPVRSAERITGFGFTVSRPNPPDLDKLIHDPLERGVQALKAQSGRVHITGSSLDKELVESTAKSLASAGEKVHADVVLEEGEKAIRAHLSDHPVSHSVDDRLRDKPSIIEMLTEFYRKTLGRPNE